METQKMHLKKAVKNAVGGRGIGIRNTGQSFLCGLLIYDLFSLAATQKLMSHRWLQAKKVTPSGCVGLMECVDGRRANKWIELEIHKNLGTLPSRR